MTKIQYINPECEKFTISGVDYYVHPEFTPLGVSMDGRVSNVKTMKAHTVNVKTNVVCCRNKVTQTIKVRRMLALAFVPIEEGRRYAGRKFGDETCLTIENTEWRTSRHETLYSTNLVQVENGSVLKSFESMKAATKFVSEESGYEFIRSVKKKLAATGRVVSVCGKFALVSA